MILVNTADINSFSFVYVCVCVCVRVEAGSGAKVPRCAGVHAQVGYNSSLLQEREL